MFQVISAPCGPAAPGHPTDCSPGGGQTEIELDPLFLMNCWLTEELYTPGFGKKGKEGGWECNHKYIYENCYSYFLRIQ